MLDQWTAFQNLEPTLPTMQPGHWMTYRRAIYLMTCSFLWSHFTLLIIAFNIPLDISLDHNGSNTLTAVSDMPSCRQSQRRRREENCWLLKFFQKLSLQNVSWRAFSMLNRPQGCIHFNLMRNTDENVTCKSLHWVHLKSQYVELHSIFWQMFQMWLLFCICVAAAAYRPDAAKQQKTNQRVPPVQIPRSKHSAAVTTSWQQTFTLVRFKAGHVTHRFRCA